MTRIQMRRATTAQWTAANPVLASGEHGYETDTGQEKIGNGVTVWAALAYATTVRTNSMNLRKEVAPSGSDDTAAVNAALARFAAAGGGLLFIPRDNWKFTGSTGLALTGVSVPIHIEAEPGTVFDMTGSTATTGLTLGGSVTATAAALGADAAKADGTITCGLTVIAGDIVRIQSTDLWDTQPRGELAEVVSAAAGTITLRSGLWDAYAAATTTVTLMQMPRVSVKNLTIARNSNHAGLIVQYARDVELNRVRCYGARERLMEISNVLGATIKNCSGEDFWYSGTGTSYGLAVSSCQHVREIGNMFRGGRHAVAHGGSFPCRDIQVFGGTFDNYHASAQASFDFHSNCENVRIVGATFLQGIVSSAANVDITDCTVRIAGDSGRNGIELALAHSSDYVRVRRTDVQVAGAAFDAVLVTNRSGATATNTKLVEVDGYLRSGTTGAAVRVGPASSSDTGAVIERLEVSGILSGASGVVLAKNGAAEETVKSVRISGRVTATTGHGITVTNIASEQLYIDNAEVILNTVTKSAYTGTTTGSMDVIIRNSRLASVGVAGDRNYFGAGRVIIQDSTIEGFGAVGGVSAASASEAFVSGVRNIGSSGVMALPARHYSRINSAGKVVTQGTAAPTAGTWVVGDFCENTVPAVGSPKGWLCTVAGTPGTWVSTGNL